MPHGAQAAFDSSVRYYDIFEKRSDGSMAWREAILGLQPARSRLAELARRHSTRKFVLMDLYRDKVIE
jgi:hypothetical protein